jgi:DNA polymerase IV
MALTSVLPSVLHLDADAFFASVEQRDDPQLRGRPVAVGSGVVASCSYEARRWGVRTGMRLGEARHLCRRLLILPGNYRRYEQAARSILAICQDQTPIVEVAALDDLYLEVAQNKEPGRIAGILREQVRDEIGLSISIGIGVNKLIAKVATKKAKPGKQVLVPRGEERDYLAPLPTRVLPGVGRKVGGRLDRLNVQQVREVAAMPLPILCTLFGNQGKVLRNQAHGIDPRPVEPYKPAQSVSRCTSFDPPVSNRDFLKAMLDHLTERAVSWLRFNNWAIKGLAVSIRYGDYESDLGRESFRLATANEEQIKEAARDRFERLYVRRLPLRLIGIEFPSLVSPDPQPMLFAEMDAVRRRRLIDCKDAIRQRFGFMSLTTGSSLFLSEQLDQDRENYRLRTPSLTR